MDEVVPAICQRTGEGVEEVNDGEGWRLDLIELILASVERVHMQSSQFHLVFGDRRLEEVTNSGLKIHKVVSTFAGAGFVEACIYSDIEYAGRRMLIERLMIRSFRWRSSPSRVPVLRGRAIRIQVSC